MPEVQLATFTADGMLFGIDVSLVQEVVGDQHLEPVPRAPHGVVGILNLRGRILAVTDLRARLGLPSAGMGGQPLFVVRGKDGLDALRIDTAGEVLHVDSEDLLPIPDTTPAAMASLLSGAYDVPDLLLVIDLNRLLDTADDWVAMPHDGPGH